MAALFHGSVGGVVPNSTTRSQSMRSPQGVNAAMTLKERAHSEGVLQAPPSTIREWFSNSQAHRRVQDTTLPARDGKGAEDTQGGHQHSTTLDSEVDEPGGNKDWNKAWQEALEMPSDSKSNRWERLAKLSADFKATAENYTRVK
jgi:hypothetical protein